MPAWQRSNAALIRSRSASSQYRRCNAAVFGTGSASNYNITYATGTYTVTNLLGQTITWTSISSKTYGDTATARATASSGLAPVVITSLTPSICTVPSSSSSGATVTILAVGICRLNAAQAGDSTYGPASDVVESFTVNAAPLSITASSPTGIRYRNSVPTVTPSFSGFVNSENSSALSTQPTCTTAYTTSSGAGTIHSTTCSGAVGANYSITYTAGSFTVLGAPLTITASSPTGVKTGDAVPTITASYSGFVNSETESVLIALPTCITSYTTSSAAGSTESTSCSGASGSNYTITYVAGSFVVAAANNGNNGNNPAPTPVVKQKPTINWNNPSPIFVGTPLSGTQLNALLSVPGTCVYTPALGTQLPAGTHTLSVTCTPTDSNNYEPVSTTVTIQVKPLKKKPSILWFNPSPIFNPTPLTGTQLNAQPSVPGTLEYTPGPGTVLEPGSHVLNVKLKPNNPDYEELETKVTILVKTKPVTPNDPTPATPNTPAKPEVKEPEAPKKPALAADSTPIATPKNSPVLQTEGKPEEVIVVKPNAENTGYVVSAADWSLAIASTTKFVQGNTADSTARVVIEKGNTVTTSGTGFKPFSQVDVYVYSTPTWLGAVMTDEFGKFTTTLPMPKSLPEGDHTFQAKGVTPDLKVRTAAVPITLIPARVSPGSLKFEVYFKMNSTVITKAESKKIALNVKKALAQAASDATITSSVVGWVQPNPKPGNITYLSTNRAKNVAAVMKKLGLKGSFTLNFPGLDKDNIPSARHASVTISWSNSKSPSL